MGQKVAIVEREERRKHDLKEYLIRDINELSIKLDSLRPLAHNIAYLTRELNLDSTFNFLTEIEDILLSISDKLRSHSNRIRKLDQDTIIDREFKAGIKSSVNPNIIRAIKK
jgi:hypothetical protein